jgi:hypothetical protein
VLTCRDFARNFQLILCLIYCSILRWDLPGVFEEVVVYYSKLNTILTECSWGDPGKLALYDKHSREIPVEYTAVN